MSENIENIENIENPENIENTESAENTAGEALKNEAENDAEREKAKDEKEEKEEKEEKNEKDEKDDEEKSHRKDKGDKKLKSKLASLEKEVEELKKQNAELDDKYLRLMAEYRNFRERSRKEKDGIYSDAVSDSVKELLSLFDNLERASEYTEGDKVAEGLAMILKTVPDVLSKLKVESYGEVGETFNPDLHNAIMHEENEEKGESEIVEVFRKGYKIGDKIIRHAMVKVAN